MAEATQENRILYLDGWRGLAILGVIFAHYFTMKGLNLGRFGVELFFVLSGRLMAEVLFERNTPLLRFFPRRFARVWPTLAIFATACWAASWVGWGDADFSSWLAALTFTTNYAGILGVTNSSWLHHTWSLCIEEHVYILLGLIALVNRTWNTPPLPLLLALCVFAFVNGAVQTWAFSLDYYEVFWRTDVRGASIILGAAAFLLAKKTDALRAPVAIGMIGFLLQANAIPDPIKYSIGSACLAWSVATLPAAKQVVTSTLSRPEIVFFGAISYSLYLWQQPLFKLIDAAGGGVAARALLASTAVLVAFASYRLIEKPARGFLNSQLDRLIAGPQRVKSVAEAA